MEALLAIAMLCQASGILAGRVDRLQQECQKWYVQCYEEKLASVPAPGNEDPKVWFGRLKDCVKER